MAGDAPRGSFWPSRTQELLLVTGLAPPEAGLAAWRQLRDTLDLDTLEGGTIAVLPLVYRALSRAAPDDPLLPRLKGVYRNAWVRNNLLSQRLAEIVDAFDTAGIQPLLIGSLAAAIRYYPEPALRPTPALDLLIAPGAVKIATRELGRLGWSAPGEIRPQAARPTVFANALGQTCMIRVTPSIDLNLSADQLRSASVGVQIGGSAVAALGPADDLLIACVSGARTRPVRSVQWVLDMAQILRSVPAEVDWERVIGLAAAQGQTLRLRRALAYVLEVVAVPVPAAVREVLDAASVSFRERLAYTCAGSSPKALGSLSQGVAEHLIATRERSPLGAVAAFPDFLRARWEVQHRWQLPLAGGRRVFSRLTHHREPSG